MLSSASGHWLKFDMINAVLIIELLHLYTYMDAGYTLSLLYRLSILLIL